MRVRGEGGGRAFLVCGLKCCQIFFTRAFGTRNYLLYLKAFGRGCAQEASARESARPGSHMTFAFQWLMAHGKLQTDMLVAIQTAHPVSHNRIGNI